MPHQSPRGTNRVRLALLAGLVLFAAACGKRDSTWQAVQSRGTLRVGMDASYPPFENVAPDGSLAGFDVDMAEEIGRRLNLEIEYVNIAYDGLYDALVVGRADALISALRVREDQLGRVVYTVPYFNAGDMLVAPLNSGIGSMEDLEGGVLAVEYGAEGDVQARAWQRRLSSLEVMRLPDPGQALAAVEAGEADAALIDGISARMSADEHPSLAPVDTVTEDLYAVAVRKDSTELAEQISAAIGEMLDDGTMAELEEKWF
jgi:polar amino acid transport system substrate-binding protein